MTDSGERTEAPLPRLHVVTDDGVLEAPGFLRAAREVMAAGGSAVAVHLRGPRTAGRRLVELGSGLAEAARETGARLLVNDRLDVALALEADGVQLGARSLEPADARRLLAPRRWVGVSVHSAAEARRAAADGADFLLAGTLFASASHPGLPGSGTGWLRELRPLGLPVIGIGGITAGRVHEVRTSGGWGVAVIGAVWAAAEPGRAVESLLRAMDDDDGN